MSRAFLIVLDSVGIGGAPDAATFGDEGANTVAHIFKQTGVDLPNLMSLGLGQTLALSSGYGDAAKAQPQSDAFWGAATESSAGKDTPTGHWELAGVPVPWTWHNFPDTEPCFPEPLTARVCKAAGTDGILGNRHASGTEIIAKEGEAHLESGWPICYTSADSVFQIAAHEEHFGLDRLLELCQSIAPVLHDMKVGRVIARPFIGEPGAFERTANRRDYAIAPPAPTLCDWANSEGHAVHGIGKIGDIFSMRGLTDCVKGPDVDLMDHLHNAVQTAANGAFVFANFVEFDSKFGHRRDPDGYAGHLRWFDDHLPRLISELRSDDLMLITADHGNDPTWRGTDHTRERVPVLGLGGSTGSVGLVDFVDVAASIAAYLGLSEHGPGKSFL